MNVEVTFNMIYIYIYDAVDVSRREGNDENDRNLQCDMEEDELWTYCKE